MDITTLVAALLHDTVEDTGYSLDRASRSSSASEVAPPRRRRDQARQGQVRARPPRPRRSARWSSRWRKDPRVLVIKLADRLHNMRTLRFLPPEKQERKARETLEISRRSRTGSGMNTVKWELEDLAFATLYPKRYDEIVRLVAERAPSARHLPAAVIGEVQGELRTAKIKADGHRPPEALLLDLPEDDRARATTSPTSTTCVGRPRPGRLGPRLLRGAGHDARDVEPGARAGSRTTSRCPSSTCTSRCTPR